MRRFLCGHAGGDRGEQNRIKKCRNIPGMTTDGNPGLMALRLSEPTEYNGSRVILHNSRRERRGLPRINAGCLCTAVGGNRVFVLQRQPNAVQTVQHAVAAEVVTILKL